MPIPTVTSESFANGVEKIARFHGQTVVVKLGGSAMEDPAATDACLRSVAVLNRLGIPIVLVHGGGKPIDRAMAEAGLVPKKVAGRRYTDKATREIVVKVLLAIGAELVVKLDLLGCPARRDSDSLRGKRFLLAGPNGESIDLGYVGEVTQVSLSVGRGSVAVVPSIALDSDHTWLNVNADTAAAAVAGALQAEKAIFLTDTPGVLRDRNDPKSLLPKLSEAECRALIASGAIAGGMVPKVEACFEALAAGAKSALILDGREPFSLLDVFLHDSFSGTEITK